MMIREWSARWREDGGAFDEFPELGTEPGGGRAVDDVVVDGQREIENVPDLDVITDDARLPGEPADDHFERHHGHRRDAEAPQPASA